MNLLFLTLLLSPMQALSWIGVGFVALLLLLVVAAIFKDVFFKKS